MSEEINKQVLDKFTQILADESKTKVLQDLIEKVQNNSLQLTLENIDKIQQNHESAIKCQQDINNILEKVKTSQKKIDEIYHKIYDINNGENEENSSQALKDIETAQNTAKLLEADYNRFYDTKDSQGNITQGLSQSLMRRVSKLMAIKTK